jgi:hypothetical protein
MTVGFGKCAFVPYGCPEGQVCQITLVTGGEDIEECVPASPPLPSPVPPTSTPSPTSTIPPQQTVPSRSSSGDVDFTFLLVAGAVAGGLAYLIGRKG